MNNTGAPQGKVLGVINLLFNRSCNYSFNSFNSIGAIRYSSMDMGYVPVTKSMPKSISLTRGNSGRSFRSISGNSLTIWTDPTPGTTVSLSLTNAKKP